MKSLNPIKKLFIVAKADANLSDKEIAGFLGISREAVCRQLNKPATKWTIDALLKYADVLDIEKDDILGALKECLKC